MRTFDSIQKLLASNRAELFDRYKIKTLGIFGSYARNEQTPNSDVDILVEFDAPVGIEFIDLANHLEDVLQMHVDLVSRHGIKPKYFHEIQTDLRYV